MRASLPPSVPAVSILEPDRNCWRIARADKAALIVDAAEYFRLARCAMMDARDRILLIGWDFDTRISLERDSSDDAPERLGAFLSWLAKRRPRLDIRILNWDVGAIKLLGRGTTALRLARWMTSKQITFKLDGAHPVGASHHQKILVIDDALAFCGGIDMTADRWDTRAHKDGDPRRRRPTTGRRYKPWHDCTMAVSGTAARALGELARERWTSAGGSPIPPAGATGTAWPDGLEADFAGVDIAIARTRGAYHGAPGVREIEALFVDMIAGARRFIYAENQYFASRVIAAAMAKRLAEPKGPEIILVNPRRADGWLEEEVMGTARARLIHALSKVDRHRRFRIHAPVTAAGDDIYVHAKVAIVDDEMLRVGSANMNNRSMGLDSECDLLIDSRLPGNGSARKRIAAIRAGLMAEHLGVTAAVVDATVRSRGSLIAAIDALRGEGRTLVPCKAADPGALEKTIADSEALDPESSDEDFEPRARPGLLAGLGPRRWRRWEP